MHTSCVPVKKLPVLSVVCAFLGWLLLVAVFQAISGYGFFFGPKYTVFFILSKLT